MQSPEKKPSAARRQAQRVLMQMPTKERQRLCRIEALRRGLEPKKG